IEGQKFFQRHWEHKLPPFVETVEAYSEHTRGDSEYLLCNNLATLIWMGQLANLEFHSWFSRIDPKPDATELPETYTRSLANVEKSLLNYPDFLIVDLDPYIYSGKEKEGAEPEFNPAAFAKAAEIALAM